MSRAGSIGYQPGTKVNKTGEFWLDVAMGLYAPNWQNVLKFGVNKSVANGTWELISQTSAAYPLISTATTVRVKAGGDAADTLLGAGANTVRVVGLNSDATAQITEDIDLAGASASASTTQAFFRVYHAEAVGCGTYATAYNTGPIVIENTAGTLDLLTIEAAHSMSQHLAFSAPAGLSVVILGEETHVEATKPANIRIRARTDITNTTAPVAPVSVLFAEQGVDGGAQNIPLAPFSPIVGPADVWIEAYGAGAITQVSGAFQAFCYPTP